MAQYQEKPTSKRSRLLYIILVWIPVGAMMIGLSFLMGWWVLILWAAALWSTWDYWRKGDMYGAAEGVSRAGRFVPDAWKDDDSSR